MRVRFKSEIGQGMNALTARFTDISETCGKDAGICVESAKRKVLFMVSRFGYCLKGVLCRVWVGRPIRDGKWWFTTHHPARKQQGAWADKELVMINTLDLITIGRFSVDHCGAWETAA